ncbi:hypothetical protein [Gilvimarinus chinensis]|uniref:hypothetical protein n=1 Tax=Gilvimarinus chinensis TaxID=396005 RepID=UPI0003679FCC|nr:hypothetical protein [Gilvimarinus chinensis]
MRYVISLLSLFLFSIYWFGENNQEGLTRNPLQSLSNGHPAEKVPPKPKSGEKTIVESSADYNDESMYQERKEHLENYVIGVNDEDYKVYDLETLLSLAEGGDVKAMKVAALKMMDKSEKAESAEESLKYHESYLELLESAVVYGDREVLGLLRTKYVDGSPLLMDSASEAEKANAMIEALAYYEFLGLRGDFGGKYYGQKFFFKSFMPEKTSLSSIEVRGVKKRAKDIYDHYEGQRLELGLGPFDNSIPEAFQVHIQALKAEYAQEMGALAIK